MRIFVLALVSVLFLACGQEQTALAPNGPQFDWMNNPDNVNLRISRYGTDFAISWTDPKTGLRATHTTFSLGTEPGCGPGETLYQVDAQDVGLPDFNDYLLSWLRRNVNGELWIFVRDMNTPGDCVGKALIAQGVGTFHNTDNDVFGYYPEGGSIRHNDNTYGYMAEGKLTGVNGETLQYSGHSRVVWDPQAGVIGDGKFIQNATVNIQ